MEYLVTHIIGLLTAIGTLLIGVGTFRINHKANRNHDATVDVRDQLNTTNGHTIGALIEQNLPASTGDQVAVLDPRPTQATADNPSPRTTQ